MNKLYLLLLLAIGSSVFGQQKGISYQAVIINPNEIKAPGLNSTYVPLSNKAICLSFQIVNNNNQVEYQESQSITTDVYGMVNMVIGTGTSGTGLVTKLDAVNWNQGTKKLVVGVNTEGVCSNYTEISNQVLNYTPYSFYAQDADLKDGYVTDVKLAMGINPTKVGLGNVNNTSDANKPISTATQTALDLKANATDVTTSLALKEDASNKSNATLGTSTTLYPTQNAVKTYVDVAIAGATIVDADANTKGKIQLTGDLGGTSGAPTVPGLALKLDASQKGVPNGLATLNSSGIIPSSQLPPVTISSTNVVASQADMLALSTAIVGSIAVRTDVNKNYVLAQANPSVLANWIELLTPGAPVQSVNGITGSVLLTKGNVGLANVDNTSDTSKPISTATQNALNLKLNTNQVGVANGTASLNALGKIPTDQIPAISFSSVKVLNSQADMLAINNAVIGSVVIRTDVNKNYVLAQANPSIQANWIELLTPAPPVQTVNGYTGSISLTNSDIGLANVDNTSDTNKPVSAAQQTALNLKADVSSLANVAITGDYKDLNNLPTSVDASSLSGTLAISKGGTGATTLTGLVKGNGTNALTTAVDGTDYLSPTGSAASLTNFPILNQNTTGTAANVTGTVAIINGGTGATTLTGIIKGNGSNALTAAVDGTDYLSPTGSAASLTNFPRLNQNTTGTAANVTGIVSVANGGTGATTAATAFSNLIGTQAPNTFLAGPQTNMVSLASYDGSSLTGWTSTGGASIDNATGNPSSSFKITGGNQFIFRDFGQNLQNKTIQFDIQLTSGKTGINFGTDANAGNGGLGLTLYAGINSRNGLIGSQSWLYTDDSGDNYTFTPGTWYTIKIITDNGMAGGTSWYVNGSLVGTSGGYGIGGGTYFGIASDNGTAYFDNLTISGVTNAADAVPTFRQLVAADFPTLNQNTTGNAATATIATNAINITSASNASLTSLSNLNTVGTITSGTWGATEIDIAHGGTGATSATAALTNLGAAAINANLNDQTGSTYTLLASDNGKVITLNNASAITLTVPAGLAAGFNCMIVQKGDGVVTITPSGVSVTNRSGGTKTGGKNAIVSLIALTTTYFITGGDMQ